VKVEARTTAALTWGKRARSFHQSDARKALAAANLAWLLEQFCELEQAVFMAHALNSAASTTSCCGPRRPSGSSAENAVAIAPLPV
jgi:hypothetical protein